MANVDSYPEFDPGEPSRQKGHFLVLDFSSEEEATITTSISDADVPGDITVTDGYCVYRIKNTEQKITVKATNLEKSTTKVYSLSGLVLE